MHCFISSSKTTIFFALALAMLSNSECIAEGKGINHQKALFKRFLEGARNAQNKINKASFAVRVSLHREFLDKKEEQKERDKPKVEGTLFKCREGIRYALKSQADGMIYVINPDYAFVVNKTVGTKAPYSIKWLGRPSINPKDELATTSKKEEIMGKMLGAWYMYDKTLIDIAEDPEIQISSMSPDTTEEGGLIKIEFANTNNVFKDSRFSNTYLICDENTDWAIREFGFRMIKPETNVKLTSEIQFVGNIPIPKSLVAEYINDDGEVTMRWTHSIEIVSADMVPKEEFYLSYYGLPEPNFESKIESAIKDAVHEGRLPVWLWYLVIGIICLGMGVWIRRRVTTA